MNAKPESADAAPLTVLVAGDVCLDVVGVPMPPRVAGTAAENWRLSGETRTHFLPGGAILLSRFVEDATATAPAITVIGPQPKKPAALTDGADGPLPLEALLQLGPRLSREDIVHSLLRLKAFPTSPGAKKKDTTLRVDVEGGFSGPDGTEPLLQVAYPGAETARVIVIDDSGNGFRHRSGVNPWPSCLESPPAPGRLDPLVIYKLHKPLPGSGVVNPLWDTVAARHQSRRVVIVPADDLRAAGAPISQGLSWERTALDVVWQLLNFPKFSLLRDCPWLIVRLGLDGALIWQHNRVPGEPASYKAWILYDPEGIEGEAATAVSGHMVGVGAAFTAAVVRRLIDVATLKDDDVTEAATSGLQAARRLIHLGFGTDATKLAYPRAALFTPRDGETTFAAQPVPIIPDTLTPDRAGWRLLDQVFDRKNWLLERAVIQVATGSKPPKAQASEPSAAANERTAAELLQQVPMAEFGKLRTYDRREIESYRSLYTLLRDYLSAPNPARPLSIAVFGPPGAGKSFGVKQVAASLKGLQGCRDVVTLTFNLSLYDKAEDLAGAFHLVRDEVLRGRVPLVFFDEFDASLGGQPLAWLRQFLAPMQDGEFLDRAAPHPIGQSVFIFAGGTCATYREFSSHLGIEEPDFRQRKGPDFLSRLRATLDIPSLNLLTACCPSADHKAPSQESVQSAGTFDPLGPIEAIPSEAAVLLRRATILGFNLRNKGPELVRSDNSLDIHPAVLRPLLFLPEFNHGNRSFEALMDMSHLADAKAFAPSQLPPDFQLSLHANAAHLNQLVDVTFPFPPVERETIAKEIHRRYLEQNAGDRAEHPDDPSYQLWEVLNEDLRESNRGQADEIVVRLRSVHLWFRRRPSSVDEQKALDQGVRLLEPHVDRLACAEHDRWCAQKRRQGWIAGLDNSKSSKIIPLLIHNCLFPWDQLTGPQKDLDRAPIRAIPALLACAGYQVIKPQR
jgi:RyR domain